MKPVKISIQAFGPYFKKTEIDFTPLYNNGLFLISGPTGCGKTTILDAMSFALYGQASGEVRDVRDMRSTSAPDDFETRVVFEMKLGEEHYRFDREIKIRIIKKRNGTVEKAADYEASCEKKVGESWQLLCSGTQVKEKAAELLGFSHEQFSQVVVLPQGEFRRLLTASSQDKQKILEKLFGTHRWQNFTDLLAKKSKEIKGELLKCSERTKALCESVNCENAEEVATNCEETEKELKAAKEILKTVCSEYKKAETALKEAEAADKKFSELETAEKDFAALNSKKPIMEQKREKLLLCEKAAAVLPYLNAFEASKKAFDMATQDLNSAKTLLINSDKEKETSEKAAEEAAKLLPKIDNLSKEAAKLALFYDSAVSLSKAASDLKIENNKLSKAAKDCEIYAKNSKAAQEKIEKLKREINTLSENYVSKYPELIKKQNTLQLLVKNFDDLSKLKLKAENSYNLLKEKGADYKKAQQHFENEKNRLEELKTLFDGDSAYKLSQNLKEGEECPVCGSKSHPKPALSCMGAPTKEELENQKSICDELEKALKDKFSKGERQRADYESAKKQYEELKSECQKAGISEEDARNNLSDINSKTDSAKRAAEQKKNLEENLKAEETAFNNLSDEAKSLEEKKNELASITAQLEGKVAELKKTLPKEFQDPETILKRTRLCKDEHDKLLKETEEARTRFEKAKSALAAAKERKSAAKKALESAEKSKSAAKTDFIKNLSPELPKEAENIRALALSEEERTAVANALNAFDNSLFVTSKQIEKLKDELKNESRPETASVLSKKEEAFSRMNAQTEATTRLSGKKESLEEVKKSLIEAKKKEDSLTADYALYDNIYSLSNGNNPKKTPIHQFVLGLMLEDIVASANTHLSKLSSGRYTLVKSEEPSRGGGTKGLELSVDDAWSGGERSVNTLSGGEMFLASLSLAFGLSDVVQSYAGGIRLDSLFIDEGFGSLDTETLEISMNALESLRMSGRLVGVISHVSELSDRIHDRINVTRLKDGTAYAKVETEV